VGLQPFHHEGHEQAEFADLPSDLLVPRVTAGASASPIVALADRCSGFLNRLKQNTGTLRVTEPLELAATVPIRFAISLLLMPSFSMASATSQDNTRFETSAVTAS